MRRHLVSVFTLFMFVSTVFGQAISRVEHIEQLSEIKKRADDFGAKNLCRYGLPQLQQYDKTFDYLYNKEKTDSLNTLSNIFKSSGAVIQEDYAILKKKKETYVKNQAGFNNSYASMLTKTTLALVVLSVLFIFILIVWKRKLNARREETTLYKTKLQKAQAFAAAGDELVSQSEKSLSVYSSLGGNLKETNPESGRIMQLNIPENSQWKEVMMHSKKINQLIQTETSKNAAIVDLVRNEKQEKTKADINQLCLNYFELVKDGFPMPDGSPQIKASTDLEKNLPQIKIVPAAIGHLLIHVLTNAMQSVQARAMKKIKGYEPRVTLSTRILPRFVQIRINDNGVGIEDKYIEKVKEAFFSLKKDSEAGLGLYVSDLIMKNHQGEIKIECDKNRGTDVYLKFFIP